MVKISSFTKQTPSLTSCFPFVDESGFDSARNKKCDLQSIFDFWEDRTNLANFVKENEPHTFSANQATMVVDLQENTNILVPGASANYFRLLLTQSNSTLRPPYPLRPGPYLIAIKQDSVGGRSLIFDEAYRFPKDFDSNLSTAPNAEDVVSCIYNGWSLYAHIARF